MEASGIVFDISHYMTEDGPGIRTNVFLKGCPLSCKWCSNVYGLKHQPQMAYVAEKCIGCTSCVSVCKQDANTMNREQGKVLTDFSLCVDCMNCIPVCPSKARRRIGNTMTVSQVVAEVEKDRMFYRRGDGGITLSGGEVLLQTDFAEAILQSCQDRFINTAMESSAYGTREDLRRLITRCDTVFLDCKCFSEELHKELTGVSNALILENIALAAETMKNSSSRLIVRMPLVPGMNDDPNEIRAVGSFVESLPGDVLLNILPYHNYGVAKYAHLGKDYPLGDVERPDHGKIAGIKQLLTETGVHFSIGGYDI